jgi:glycosyltransferase involved in cell wall biosynthesis
VEKVVRPALAIVVSHPIQYQAPLFRRLHARGRIAIEVLFLSDHGVDPSFDAGFGRQVRYDVPLTEGYPHRFLANVSPRPSVGRFTGLINPGVVRALATSGSRAVLVHGYGHVSECLALALAKVMRVPYLMLCDSRNPAQGTGDSPRWRVKRVLVGAVMRGAACCLANGLLNGRYYLDLGVRPDRIGWAPMTIDQEFFAIGGAQGRAEREQRLRGIGLDPELPVALFAAKLQPRKRVLDFVAAGDRLDGRMSFVVVGDGEQRAAVEAAARSRPWLASLGFVNQQELARWYGTADVFVLPGEREPWGLAVAEAMAAGALPVVTDDVGCAPDLVEGIGRVVPVGSADVLAHSISDLAFGHPGPHADANLACRLRRYSIDAQAKGIEDAVLAL